MILSIHKKLSMLKNLSMLEPNFEKADGLGICMPRDFQRRPQHPEIQCTLKSALSIAPGHETV